MLPTLSVEQPEAMLRKLEKKKHESLLEYATRFSVTASTFRDDQLTEGRKAKLLFTKLPRDLQRQLAILNFEECTVQKLITRVRNYLDWMAIGDQKAWQGQLGDFMDVDSIQSCQASEVTETLPATHNVNNADRVVLPGNRINWNRVNNIPSFMIAFRCLMRTNSTLRNEALQWLNQRPMVNNRFGRNGNRNTGFHRFNRGGQRFGNNRFGQFPKRSVNEIEDMKEGLDEEQFDVFDLPLKDTQETISEEQEMNTVALDLPEIQCAQSPFVEMPNMITAAKAAMDKDTRRLLHCKIQLNQNGTQALIDTGAAVSILSLRTCQKFGFAVDSSRTELLCGFNNSVTRTNGTAKVNVTIEEQNFSHEFHVIALGSQKVIIGNDILIAQDAIIYPGREYIVLKEKMIYCHHVAAKPTHDRIRLYSEAPEQLRHGFPDAIGQTLYSAYNVEIPAHARRQIYTGVQCKIPPGQIGWITGLPSLALTEMLDVIPMTLDQSYAGQVTLILHNHNDKTVTLEAGCRLPTLTFGLKSSSEIQLTSSIKAKTKETKLINASGKTYREILKGHQKPESSVPSIKPTPESKEQPNPTLRNLTMEHKARYKPEGQDGIIKLPVNRSFYLKPRESRLVYMPFRASHDIILHPVVHPTLQVHTGLQRAGQYLRLTVTNTSSEMVHIIDRMTLTCLKPMSSDSWRIQHRDFTSILSFFA